MPFHSVFQRSQTKNLALRISLEHGDKPKRDSCLLKRLICESGVFSSTKVVKRVKTDRNLYEVEVTEVDKARNLVRIHCKGYSEKYDECGPYSVEQESYFPFVRQERKTIPDAGSLEERAEFFKHKLYTEVERKLFSGRREDVNVRIKVDVGQDVFIHVLGIDEAIVRITKNTIELICLIMYFIYHQLSIGKYMLYQIMFS